MPNQKDSLTVALVIFVSLIAVNIGVQNFEWGLKTTSKVFTHLETGIKNK